MSTQVDTVLNSAPVMPVLVIERVEDAVPLAKALKAGGLNVLEVTLRTSAALEAIHAIVAEVQGVIVGAGTVTRASELAEVAAAGATFAISPGATAELLKAGLESNITYIPAISTVSELMNGLDAGYRAFKFFPAEASGGTAMLKSIAGPFPDVRFCPTGGIGPDNFMDYLNLPNVSCVGGSWVVPAGLIRQQDWEGITALAAAAVERAGQRG
ncbi:bifunctional 4-hydroxy-2-oxoglutarate aldolase/2-dehydro-3-deoxy-phosphogluconate aldolase [Marinobacterium sp. D7]|uniref:bifunctional 4-hydroxy-2-oxoglutarate aldolase/2-dehydro-3-deoxy-phosphogluconate aldolase n=1 Tax=Marinobacterium ramblicola TaxID=2849041 RepID=UPI001C2D5CE2|nr:bifunctional 4-hydroxy-2-oxoglutarate aldolase/2-dehydro-3-deoxy-phosphogluconate aldolase [Marinobacterium ramblicola]MBV1787695.1 bifunctional 4-hydroxy-2-oxoglutarate aldolase/2-dehydro-3-deoxy-phosphogluconate aldolase [Marinobacterium ramblicola]